MRLDPAEWRDIPGFGGMYQANVEGQIRRVWPDGKTRILTPCRQGKGQNKSVAHVVNVYCPDGKRRMKTIAKLVAETFLGPAPDGAFVTHKNGMRTDNSLYNLEYVSREDFGRMLGKKTHRRPVVKLDSSGEVIAVYRSAKLAAEKNYISYCSMLWRCNGGPKLGPAGDGCDYAFEGDAESLKAARKRLQYVPRYPGRWTK